MKNAIFLNEEVQVSTSTFVPRVSIERVVIVEVVVPNVDHLAYPTITATKEVTVIATIVHQVGSKMLIRMLIRRLIIVIVEL